ncbi:MAG TPA: ATP-binding protein [Thermoanaerobaculia bacterium]|nr:ATP-binding protein [Thermoanaerobaculia bacterium]
MNRAAPSPVERHLIATLAIAAPLLVASTVAVLGWLEVRDTQRAAIARVARVAERYAAAPLSAAGARSVTERAVAEAEARSAVLYDRSGVAVAQAGQPAGGGSTELTCRSVTLDGERGSLCLESSTRAADELRSRLMMRGGLATAVALVAGIGLGMLLRRLFHRRVAAITAVAAAAASGHAFSLRAPEESGDLGHLAESVNYLLAQAQERDLALRRRATEVEAANRDLESFAYAVSHDLRAPLGSVNGFAQALLEDYGDTLDASGREYLQWILESCAQMQRLIDGLLQMSRLARTEMQREPADLSAIAQNIAETLQRREPERSVDFRIAPGLMVDADERLLRALLENLLANAWKFTRKNDRAVIEVGSRDQEGVPAYFVRDNGAGFDPSHASKIFRPFQRLHSNKEFEGTGIGLATVHKIIERHGGRAWAEGEVGKGAAIYFTLPTER